MNNPYKAYLIKFLETINEFKHTSKRLNKVILDDIKKYAHEDSKFLGGTALILHDWTGPSDNGWKIKFDTGIKNETWTKSYSNDIEKILSREFGYAYTQCYEALETTLKDFLEVQLSLDPNFWKSVFPKKEYSRESLRSSDEIFRLIKAAGITRYKEKNEKIGYKVNFKEDYTIFTEVRHAITHSSAVLKTNRIPDTYYYRARFNSLLPENRLEGETVQIKFDYNILNNILIYLAEFGYQIYKAISVENGFEWKLEKDRSL